MKFSIKDFFKKHELNRRNKKSNASSAILNKNPAEGH